MSFVVSGYNNVCSPPFWQPRWPIYVSSAAVIFQNSRLKNWGLRAVSRNSGAKSKRSDSSDEESITADKEPKKSRRAPRRGKKAALESQMANAVLEVDSKVSDNESTDAVESSDKPKKAQRRSQKKVSSETEGAVKKVRRRAKRKKDGTEGEGTDSEELSDLKKLSLTETIEQEDDDLHLKHDGEDISYTYGWPPLVCCFGAAHYAFLPSGRPANRLIDHEIHESMKDTLWELDKFVRAPGSSSSSVALALAAVGGRVAFMGKLGADEYGQTLLYHLNANHVQTRSVKVDSSKLTSVSFMKLCKRGGLRMTCVRPCAEDSLRCSEINVDVLKEARMFYFNSTSLLDQNMRSVTIQAIKASKKFGGMIFFDLNLPLPLWQSSGETKDFISEAWNLADFVEVTKQELEFLCGIKPTEEFDTKHNDKSKFVHYKADLVKTLWHENLKVLFVTNGTSKIHFYTEKDNGAILGMEDAPITPFTADMSASGDAVVAALMRMLTVQPDLTTDKGYLQHMIKYAISCGVTDQWILARIRGYPPKQENGEPTFDPNRIRSITEKDYRTVDPNSASVAPAVNGHEDNPQEMESSKRMEVAI